MHLCVCPHVCMSLCAFYVHILRQMSIPLGMSVCAAAEPAFILCSSIECEARGCVCALDVCAQNHASFRITKY